MDKWRDFGEFSSDFLPVGSNTGSMILSDWISRYGLKFIKKGVAAKS